MGQIEGKGKLICLNGVLYDGEWKHSQVSMLWCWVVATGKHAVVLGHLRVVALTGKHACCDAGALEGGSTHR
jgi:hypothetical protein